MPKRDADTARTRPIRSFGRVGGRALSVRQAALMETLYPRLAVDVSGPVDPATLFETPKAAYWLEIGFGGAEHLIGQAQRHPETGFLGCEPFAEGMAKALTGVEEAGLTNVRLLQDDARLLLHALPEACLDRAFILFPDPWPKTRHHKRRLVQPDFLDALARVVKPGGAARFATDWADYADQALLTFTRHPAFSWKAERAADWRSTPADHIATRYQEKKLGDCAPVFLDFVRR